MSSKLDQYKYFIYDLYIEQNQTVQETIASLATLDIQCSRSTFLLKTKLWAFTKKNQSIDNSSLRIELAFLFWIKCLNDSKILRILKIHGHQIELRRLVLIRKSMGMLRKLPDSQLGEAADIELQKVIEKELLKGNITLSGRRSVWLHLRNMGILASHERIGNALKIVDPIGVENRWKGVNRHHTHFICPGPNWCWSIDGHLKLQMFGIEIYAAIDTYSRYITWFYCGVSGKTGISVLSQFLSVIKEQNCLPLHIRSDRGSETMLLAESFWELHKVNRAGVTFPEVFWYGTSMRNVRIESWWGQLTKGATAEWKKYFRELQQQELFNDDSFEDTIYLLHIYLPLIRTKLNQFVDKWNNHKIRKQNSRPNLPTGEPYYNYNFPPDGTFDYGQEPCLHTIQQIQAQKLKNSQLYTYYDHDIYLPLETLNYCNKLLIKGGFSIKATYEDIMPNGEKTHYIMYNFLRMHVKRHVAKGNTEPSLQLLSKPEELKKTRVSKLVNEVLASELEFDGEKDSDISDSESENEEV